MGFLDFVSSVFEGLFINYLSNLLWTKQPKKNATNFIKSDCEPVEIDESPTLCSEAIDISNRFEFVINLMKSNSPNTRFSLSKIASVLELSTVGEFEAIVKGKKEPTFEFMDQFSGIFGIDSRWLKFGDSNPFGSNAPYLGRALEYYDYIISNKPRYIYFVKDNSNICQFTIVLQVDDYKCIVIGELWRLSSHVGTGGRIAIYSFYELVNKIRDKCYVYCRGIILDQNTFEELVQGKIYPLNALWSSRNSDWWDRFTDIFYEYGTLENYKQFFGIEFIKAQEIVRHQIEKYGRYLI